MSSQAPPDGFARVPTGIPGLDQVLQGGLLDGGLYVVAGTPGSGKTILANQFCFARAAAGSRSLFVTMLGESHGRMLRHLSTLDFFEPSHVPERVYYLSGAQAIESNALGNLMALLRKEIAARDAGVLVLEGLFSSAAERPEQELRRFIYQLQAEVQAAGCTALLTTDQLRPDYHPEYTLVDGIILLEQVARGSRSMRRLQVQKFRGSGFFAGKHDYEITKAGIAVYPRIESVYARPSDRDRSLGTRTPIGVAGIDRMIGGGVPSGTTTLVLGPSGVGKTVLGLHYMCAATPEQPALLFSFYETPERLLMKARSVGLGLDKLIQQGTVEVVWQPPGGDSMDHVAQRLLRVVEQRGVRRLFIDGMQGFEAATADPERLVRFFNTLFNELRVRDVTSLYTGETQILIGSEVRSPVNGLSMLSENILLLRFVERRARIHRIFSVLKVRDSAIDSALREFHISSSGIDLASTSATADALYDKLQPPSRPGPPGFPAADPQPDRGDR
jgi:circadian clock protein KaiC